MQPSLEMAMSPFDLKLIETKDNNQPANQELGDLKLLEGNTVNILSKNSYMLVLYGNLTIDGSRFTRITGSLVESRW